MDLLYSHDLLTHDHSEGRAPAHHHDHAHGHDSQDGGDEVVERFTHRYGRGPTRDEYRQLIEHGHTHEHLDHAGLFGEREPVHVHRDFKERAFTIGIGGPVGSGKTALMLALCEALRNTYSLAAVRYRMERFKVDVETQVTNDIFTKEDGEFLVAHHALPEERIRAVETGGCPHAAIREDISANLQACEDLSKQFHLDLVLVESGGDNLAANFSRELADYIVYVIDVAGGDKVPRKGGPGITQADLLVINKIDLARHVGASLDVMASDAKVMRGSGPTVFAQVNTRDGVPSIVDHIVEALKAATSAP